MNTYILACIYEFVCQLLYINVRGEEINLKPLEILLFYLLIRLFRELSSIYLLRRRGDERIFLIIYFKFAHYISYHTVNTQLPACHNSVLTLIKF